VCWGGVGGGGGGGGVPITTEILIAGAEEGRYRVLPRAKKGPEKRKKIKQGNQAEVVKSGWRKCEIRAFPGRLEVVAEASERGSRAKIKGGGVGERGGGGSEN